MRLQFIKSEFDGLLPKPFAVVNGTTVVPTEMNDMNRAEPSRYVSLQACDLLVDLDTPATTALEPAYRHHKDFKELVCFPFLDASRTYVFYRSFFVPILSGRHSHFNDYCLLARTTALDAQRIMFSANPA